MEIPEPRVTDIRVRPFEDDDVDQVVDILRAAFGKWPDDLVTADPAEFFRWKHLRNPRGRSFMLVAYGVDGVIGFHAWLAVRLIVGDRPLRALRGTDLAVQRRRRGQGVAGRIVETGTTLISPDVALTFSNPNDVSRSGTLRLGRRQVGRIARYVLLRKPLQALRSARGDPEHIPPLPPPPVSAPTAPAALADGEAVSALLSRLDRPRDRIMVAKDIDYLRWRYGAFGDYRALAVEEGRRLRGLSIFRVVVGRGGWNARICELLVEGHDRQVARTLLRKTIESVAVSHVTGCFPAGSAELHAAHRCGFVRLPGGDPLLVYPRLPDVGPDPMDPRSWALTRGDLELL